MGAVVDFVMGLCRGEHLDGRAGVTRGRRVYGLQSREKVF